MLTTTGLFSSVFFEWPAPLQHVLVDKTSTAADTQNPEPREPAPKSRAPYPQTLAGSIRNEAGDPLPGVQVSLVDHGLSDMTDALGRFRFEDVHAAKHAMVDILARKAGYVTHEQYATLGNKRLKFSMQRVKE